MPYDAALVSDTELEIYQLQKTLLCQWMITHVNANFKSFVHDQPSIVDKSTLTSLLDLKEL